MKKKKIRKLKARNDYLERDQRVVRLEHEHDLRRLFIDLNNKEKLAEKWKRVAKTEWRLRRSEANKNSDTIVFLYHKIGDIAEKLREALEHCEMTMKHCEIGDEE